MVENEVYNNQDNLYSIKQEKDVQKLSLSERLPEIPASINKGSKQPIVRFSQSKKIRRTKSAGIF